MEALFDYVGEALILVGAFFVFTGALGIIRMPDFYTRLHAAGVTDSMGVPLILLGIIIKSGFTLFSGKIIFLILFMMITGPAACHAVAKSAMVSGLVPWKKKKKR